MKFPVSKGTSTVTNVRLESHFPEHAQPMGVCAPAKHGKVTLVRFYINTLVIDQLDSTESTTHNDLSDIKVNVW